MLPGLMGAGAVTGAGAAPSSDVIDAHLAVQGTIRLVFVFVTNQIFLRRGRGLIVLVSSHRLDTSAIVDT